MRARDREPLTRPEARRRRRRRASAAIALVVLAVGGTAYGTWQYIEEQEFLLDEGCEVSSAEGTQRLTPDQAHHAALISAAAIGRGLPPEAAAHVVAFSLQESELSLRAPEDGSDAEDQSLDELHLFARGGPSWDAGTAESPTPITLGEVLASVEDRWDPDADEDDAEAAMEEGAWVPALTAEQAAEVLERPHDPGFYARHAERARAFAWPTTGKQPLGMTCRVSQRDVPAADPDAALAEIQEALPDTVEPSADAASAGGSSEAAQLELTVPARSGEVDHAWLVAQWALTAAEPYGIQQVEAEGFTWDRDSGEWSRAEDGQDAGAGQPEDGERVAVTLTFRD